MQKQLIGKGKIINQGEKEKKKTKRKGNKGKKCLYPKRKPETISAVWCCDTTPVLSSKDEKLKVQFKEMSEEW